MHKQKALLVSVLSLAFVMIAGTAFAAMTFNTNTITGDGALNLNPTGQPVTVNGDLTVTGTCTGCGGGLSLPDFTFDNANGGGTYTLANSGITFKDHNGDEIGRIWFGDPDVENYNSGNLYIGFGTGLNQPTNNTSAGYNNTGIGFYALQSNTTGNDNIGFGAHSMYHESTGAANTGIGDYSLYDLVSGTGNVGIGASTGGFSAGSNRIAIGYQAAVNTDNTAVIGDSDLTDVYLGTSSGNALAHAAAYFMGASGPSWTTDSGAPGMGACTTGSLYTRTDGGAGSTLYVCEAGSWAAK